MKNIKINFLYSIAYQLLILIIPFITTPYISRTLGSHGIGVYSYTYSIIYYFMIFGLLGINNYGNRTIAKAKNNKEQLSKSFCSIYLLQIILNLISIFLYIIYICFFCKEYYLISFIQMLYLLSNMLDINWFFFGIEKFKLTVVRSTIIKIISVVLIFLLVKNEECLWIYTLIMAGSTFLSQLLLFPFLKKEVYFTRVKFKDIKQHIKPCLLLFLPVVAISIYKFMDKIMVGIFSNMNEVGYYEQAERIINIPMGVVTALGTIMLPRISNLISNNNKKLVSQYIEKSMNLIMFLAFPLFFGIISISSKFVPNFLGSDFEKTILITNVLAITILFISFANIIRTEYLLPNEKDKDYVLSVIIGAVINLILNLILIRKYAALGAAIATVFAEFSVMLYQIITTHKQLDFKKYIKNIFPFFIKSAIMYIIIIQFNRLNLNDWIIIIMQIISGVGIYGLLNYKYIIGIIKEK